MPSLDIYRYAPSIAILWHKASELQSRRPGHRHLERKNCNKHKLRAAAAVVRTCSAVTPSELSDVRAGDWQPSSPSRQGNSPSFFA
jgi:hypothetical protein